jgi:hypothetical protein
MTGMTGMAATPAEPAEPAEPETGLENAGKSGCGGFPGTFTRHESSEA